MSNVNRPRTGMKPCAFDGATDRDSNGQCKCRNVLYRLTQRAATADQPKVKVTYNDVLKGTKGAQDKQIEKAVAAVREAFPYLAAKKTAAAKSGKAPKAEKKTAAQKKAAVKKADKIIDEAKQKAAEDAAVKAAKAEADKATEAKVGKGKYVLVLADGTTSEYARKDAAVKAGIRAEQDWQVKAPSGKVVAVSDDLI
jgi:hypothetical protein